MGNKVSNNDSSKQLNTEIQSSISNGIAYDAHNVRDSASVEMEESIAHNQPHSQRNVLLFVTLNSIGDAVITTNCSGEIDFLNPMAVALTGWDLHEAATEKIENVFRLFDEKTGDELPNPARQALETRAKVSLPEDTMLI